MNERIWELKRQAMLFAQEKCDGQATDMHGNLRSNIWTEKFAELIVQECNKIMAKQYQGPIPQDVRHMMLVLQEHFGVEE